MLVSNFCQQNNLVKPFAVNYSVTFIIQSAKLISLQPLSLAYYNFKNLLSLSQFSTLRRLSTSSKNLSILRLAYSLWNLSLRQSSQGGSRGNLMSRSSQTVWRASENLVSSEYKVLNRTVLYQFPSLLYSIRSRMKAGMIFPWITFFLICLTVTLHLDRSNESTIIGLPRPLKLLRPSGNVVSISANLQKNDINLLFDVTTALGLLIFERLLGRSIGLIIGDCARVSPVIQWQLILKIELDELKKSLCKIKVIAEQAAEIEAQLLLEFKDGLSVSLRVQGKFRSESVEERERTLKLCLKLLIEIFEILVGLVDEPTYRRIYHRNLESKHK